MKRVSAPRAPSIDCLPVLIQTCSITASKCISKLARSQLPCASLNSLNRGLQVHLRCHSITASNYITKLARSLPPNASPNSLDHGLQVNLQIRSITVSKFTRSWPPSASTHLFDHCLQVHLQTWYHIPSKVHRLTRSITAFKFISELAWLRPPSSYDLQVDLQTRSIMALECISVFTGSSGSGAPRIALKHHLQPCSLFTQSRYTVCRGGAIYRYIDTSMRLRTEYMGSKTPWTISSSFDFQAHWKCSQRRYYSQTALLWCELLPELSPALPDLLPALPGASMLVVGAAWIVAGAPKYLEGQQEYPPMVWHSLEIDAAKFTLHILSDTPGGFQWVIYILLMYSHPVDPITSNTRPLFWTPGVLITTWHSDWQRWRTSQNGWATYLRNPTETHRISTSFH